MVAGIFPGGQPGTLHGGASLAILNTVADEPDEALVERALSGESEAFGALAERYYRMVWILAYQKTGHRSDAEDVVQEAFVRAFRALGSLREGGKFASWLYNITLKLCIDLIRKRNRRDPTVPLDEEVLGRESGRHRQVMPVGHSMEVEEEHSRVLKAMGRLPDKYRLVITLRYVKKMSYKAIAAHLDEPAGTVANRLHRATRMLQEQLCKVEAAEPAEERR
jgi:RNA polymerase sigma-70 factor (ECF subfamily)